MVHETPMLSLDSIHEAGELRRFYERCRAELSRWQVPLVAEPKYDGVSVELVYENGVLSSAGTRGDGADRRGRDRQREHHSRGAACGSGPTHRSPAG